MTQPESALRFYSSVPSFVWLPHAHATLMLQQRVTEAASIQASWALHSPDLGWRSPHIRALALQGQVFAVAMHSGIIKLYDPKNYTAGPFTSFTVSVPLHGRRASRASPHGLAKPKSVVRPHLMHMVPSVDGLLMHRHHAV